MTLELPAKYLRRTLLALRRPDLPEEMRRRLERLEYLGRCDLAAQRGLRARADYPRRLP